MRVELILVYINIFIFARIFVLFHGLVDSCSVFKLQSSIRVSKLTDLVVENVKFEVNIHIRIRNAGPVMKQMKPEITSEFIFIKFGIPNFVTKGHIGLHSGFQVANGSLGNCTENSLVMQHVCKLQM